MVSCSFNGRKGNKCFVTALRRTGVILLVLGRRPLLGWRSQGVNRPWLWLWTIPVVWLDLSVAPLFRGSSIPQTDAGIWGVLFTFAWMHILWLDVTRYFVCIYVSFPLLHLFNFLFFFIFFYFFTLGTLFYIDGSWRRGTRCGHMFDSDWLGSLVSSGNLFSFSHFSRQKRPFDIYFSFLLFFPLVILSLSFCMWCLRFPALHILPFVFSVSSWF